MLAVRHDDAIAVLDIAAADAVDAVLDLLGPVRPGPGRPITVTTAADAAPELEAACRDVRMFGQLGTSTATRDGHRIRRSPRVIGFHRTACGDYRSVRFDRSGVAVEPATRARLTADLDALLAAAR